MEQRQILAAILTISVVVGVFTYAFVTPLTFNPIIGGIAGTITGLSTMSWLISP